jgi:hypothetical protein
MASTQPRIDVELRADPHTCDLSRQTRFSFVVLLTLRSERPITFLKTSLPGFDYGLIDLLRSGVVDCIDAATGENIPILARSITASEQGSSKGTSPPELMSLSNNRTNYITFTSDLKPMAYEFELAVTQLKPGRKYTIQSRSFNLDWWTHGSIDECLKHFEQHGDLPSTSTPPLQCTLNNNVSFYCQATTPPPPPVSVLLSAPSPTLSLSGDPAFSFSITFISHAPKTLTALAERSEIVHLNSDIEILIIETRNHVAPERIIAHQHGAFLREDYLVLEPETPHVEERSICAKHG